MRSYFRGTRPLDGGHDETSARHQVLAGALDRLYPRKLVHFSPLGRVVADFLVDRFFQIVAMHLKHQSFPFQG